MEPAGNGSTWTNTILHASLLCPMCKDLLALSYNCLCLSLFPCWVPRMWCIIQSLSMPCSKSQSGPLRAATAVILSLPCPWRSKAYGRTRIAIPWALSLRAWQPAWRTALLATSPSAVTSGPRGPALLYSGSYLILCSLFCCTVSSHTEFIKALQRGYGESMRRWGAATVTLLSKQKVSPSSRGHLR